MVDSGDREGGARSVAPGLTINEDEAESLIRRLGRAWWLVLVLGIVSVVVGVLVFLHPFTAIYVAAIIFGIWLVVTGVVQLIQAFATGLDAASRTLCAISGVLGIVLGLICFHSVGDRLELLVLFIGISWVIRGVTQVFAGAEAWGDGLTIFLGVVGILAGIIVLVWNIDSLPVLAVVTGIWLVVLGAIEIVSAFRIRALSTRVAGASA